MGLGRLDFGLAACLLLFVVTRPDQLLEAERPIAEKADEVTASSDEVEGNDAYLKSVPRALIETREARKAAKAAAPDRAVVAAEPKQQKEFSPENTVSSRNADDGYQAGIQRLPNVEREKRSQAGPVIAERVPSPPKSSDLSRDRTIDSVPAAPLAPVPSHRPEAKPSPLAERAEVAPAETHEAIEQAFIEPELGAADIIASSDERNSPIAVLIVDPGEAPVKLKTLARSLPKGGLAARLDEARTSSGTGMVVALITFLRDGQEIDAAIVAEERPGLAGARTALVDSASLETDDDEAFLLVELPRKP